LEPHGGASDRTDAPGRSLEINGTGAGIFMRLNWFGLGFSLLAWLACLYNARQDRLVLWSLIGGAIMVSCLAVAYQSGDLHPPLNY
jgi:hypothetical protein